jgi:uncharacterized protein YbbC (DUF1343 family)
MLKIKLITILCTFLLGLTSCNGQFKKEVKHNEIIIAANRTSQYIPLLKGKNVGVVSNHSSVIFKSDESHTHIVDSLLNLNIKIDRVFGPEHGFRGKADAGELIKDGIDTKTGLPIVSLYGSNKKPTKQQLEGLDVVVFDIQDVGVRFYTYIYTLAYVMEACAENNIPVIVLDRPNPNGHYIDGPVLEKSYKSFIGLFPIPIVYGMTIGEFAKMINGEKWLKNEIQCNLTVIPLKNYTHQTNYSLPIKPSPNLPNKVSVNLYPSLCLFEGTALSCGRGTHMQFQIFGDPNLPKEKYPFKFTPQPNEGAKHPKHEGKTCFGLDLREQDKLYNLNFEWLIDAYNNYPKKDTFFTPFFKKLAGTEKLQQQIEDGMQFEEIKKTWEPELAKFKKTRKKYLLYL